MAGQQISGGPATTVYVGGTVERPGGIVRQASVSQDGPVALGPLTPTVGNRRACQEADCPMDAVQQMLRDQTACNATGPAAQLLDDFQNTVTDDQTDFYC